MKFFILISLVVLGALSLQLNKEQVLKPGLALTLPLTRKPLSGPPTNRWVVTKDGPSKVPLNGSVEQYGEYFLSIGLGTPSVQFDFQVDTGSTDLLVYGKACDGCPANALKFDPASSSSYEAVPCAEDKFNCDTSKCYQPGNFCPFDDAYGDGSDVSGYVLMDVISVGDVPATVSLGVIQHSSAQFEPTGVDGIFGLASPVTSSWGSESPLIEWLQQNNMYKSFGMCLTADGGTLSLGINEHSNSNVQWTPTVMNQGNIIYYPVNLTDMKVGGSSINMHSNVLNGNYGALVDSGTTLMILPYVVFERLRNVFKALCSKYSLPGVCDVDEGNSLFDGQCYPMSDTDRNNFPTISFSVDRVKGDLAVGPNQYLVSQNSTASDLVWCLGIQSSPSTEKVTILGDTFMRSLYVVFDSENQSVGFGPQSACPSYT